MFHRIGSRCFVLWTQTSGNVQTRRHTGATRMTIIDSQVHAYEANTPKRPWHSVPNWPDHVTGDEMVAAIDKVRVDGAIFISANDVAMFSRFEGLVMMDEHTKAHR